MIDDTYGFDDVRTYMNYAPTLRSNRFGLKVVVGCAMRGRYNCEKK